MNLSPIEEALSLASRLWARDLMVETAGLFWIAAELAILYLVLLARFHVEHRPNATVPFITPKFRRRAWVWTAAFLLLCLAIGVRFYLFPLRDNLEAALHANANSHDIAALYARWAYTHALIWCVFITIWVILEAAIVYNGRHVYLALRKALAAPHSAGIPSSEHSGSARSPGSSACFILLLVAGAVLLVPLGSAAVHSMGGVPENSVEVFPQTHDAFAALRHAVGLYLRIAGVVWITVEWIAAFYLWRGYRLLRSAADARTTGSGEQGSAA